MSETVEPFVKGSHILEHTRHANLILQRASTTTILGIERQRKLALGNLMRQKRLIQKELSTHRSTPVSTSPCRSCLELNSKTPAFSRQETRSATLRREAIAFGTSNTADARPCRRPIVSALKKPGTEVFKSRDSIDSSEEEDRERKTSANTVDLLFEGLTVSRRTQESLKKSENTDKDILGECVDDPQVLHPRVHSNLSRSSPSQKLAKTVSFVETRNRAYCDGSPQKPNNTSQSYQHLTPSPTFKQCGNLPLSCKTAHVSAVPVYYNRSRTQSHSFSSHKNTGCFTSESRRVASRLPPSTPWAVRGNGRVYRYRPLTSPDGRESQQQMKPAQKAVKFDPWAAYKFPSVEPNQSEDSTHGRLSVFESRRGSLKPTHREEETVLYLRRVDQSRVNEIVLSKVGKFLGRNWTGHHQKDVDEDSLCSDVIDDEEDRIMIEMAHGRK